MISTLSGNLSGMTWRGARSTGTGAVRNVVLTSALAMALSGCVTTGVQPASDAIEASLRTAAEVAEQTNDYQSATGHYATLMRRLPEDTAIALALARNLRYSGKPEAAIEVIRQQRPRSPQSVDLLIELGKAYLAADEIPLSILALNEAIALQNDSWQAHAALGVAQDYQGRHDLARQAYEAALAYSPSNMSVLNNLALSSAMAGDINKAIAVLQSLAESPEAVPQIRQNLAMLLALRGDAAAAERLVRKDLPPESARHNLLLLRRLAADRTPK